jgi:hypothetical protein
MEVNPFGFMPSSLDTPWEASESFATSALPLLREISIASVEKAPEAWIKNFKKDLIRFLESLGASIQEVSLEWDGIKRPIKRAIVILAHTPEDRRSLGEAVIRIYTDLPTRLAYTQIVDRYFGR